MEKPFKMKGHELPGPNQRRSPLNSLRKAHLMSGVMAATIPIMQLKMVGAGMQTNMPYGEDKSVEKKKKAKENKNPSPLNKNSSPGKFLIKGLGLKGTQGEVDDPKNLDKKGRPKKKPGNPIGTAEQMWKTGLGYVGALAVVGKLGDDRTKIPKLKFMGK